MPQIELAGGEHDGRRIWVPDPVPRFYLVPVPVRIGLAVLPEGEMPPMPPDPLVYQREGVRDDGTDWYRLQGEFQPSHHDGGFPAE